MEKNQILNKIDTGNVGRHVLIENKLTCFSLKILRDSEPFHPKFLSEY